jgi:RHS repeat-associated protein
VTLYANGEAVAVNRYSTYDYTEGVAYLGTDVLGSVRGISNEWGKLEERYEYDAFGKPYKGDFSNGVGLGYTGKPYDTVTGMYNYGYRDYAPEVAQFTTIDPIRDGRNWFAYVNNDPINWVDLWGLERSTFANGATELAGSGEFPESGTGYQILIFTDSSSKLNVAVSVETNTEFMPPFDQTTTYTYQKDGEAPKSASHTVEDPAFGEGSMPPSTHPVSIGTERGIVTTTPSQTFGQVNSLSLADGIKPEDITSVSVSITLKGTEETVTHNFELNSPLSNNKYEGDYGD